MSDIVRCDLCGDTVTKEKHASSKGEWGTLVLSKPDTKDSNGTTRVGESISYDLCNECYQRIRAQLK